MDMSSDALLEVFLEDTGLDLSEFMAPRISSDLAGLLDNLLNVALRPTLSRIANELKDQAFRLRVAKPKTSGRVQNVKKSASFVDQKGAIKFTIDNERLALAGGAVAGRAVNYVSILNRSLRRIADRNILQRISNKDPILSELFGEYVEIGGDFLESSNAVELFAVGNDIRTRLAINKSQKIIDDRIDDEITSYFEAFLSAHDLYLQGIPAIEDVSRDIDRAEKLRRRAAHEIIDTSVPLLSELAASKDIFVESTQHALKKLSDAQSNSAAETLSGIELLRISALRGSFRTLAATMLDKIMSWSADVGKEAVKITATGMVAEFITDVLTGQSLHQQAYLFFQSHAQEALELSQSLPAYFGWLRNFLALLGF
jgi:hypothetical protein